MTPGFLAKPPGRKMLPLIEKSKMGIGAGAGFRSSALGPLGVS